MPLEPGLNGFKIERGGDAVRRYHGCLILPYLDRGGTESHTLTLAEALSKEHRVTLLAPPGTGEAALASLEGKVERIAFERFDLSPVKGWRSYRRALRALLQEAPPDFLHVHGAHELIVALPSAARGLPLLFTNHGYHGGGKGVSYRTSAWVCNRRADGAIAVSEHEREQMLRYGFRSDLVHVIHNGVKDPLAKAGREGEERRGESSKEQPITLGVVARLEKAKGIEWLIRALARIDAAEQSGESEGREHRERVRCVIVGTGSEEQTLKELAQALGVSHRVRFAGFVPNAAQMMRSFDLFVLPSLEEPFGLVCAEAMANELPVVATRVGGIPEMVVDGECGLLVPPADDAALAKAILRLASDPGLCRRMGVAGRRRFLEHFTVEAMVEKTLRLYEQVVAARRG